MTLSIDEQPWLEVAKRVLAGEFAGADTSTLKSLTIGLRLIDNPVCKEALVKLEKMLLRPKKMKQEEVGLSLGKSPVEQDGAR